MFYSYEPKLLLVTVRTISFTFVPMQPPLKPSVRTIGVRRYAFAVRGWTAADRWSARVLDAYNVTHSTYSSSKSALEKSKYAFLLRFPGYRPLFRSFSLFRFRRAFASERTDRHFSVIRSTAHV